MNCRWTCRHPKVPLPAAWVKVPPLTVSVPPLKRSVPTLLLNDRTVTLPPLPVPTGPRNRWPITPVTPRVPLRTFAMKSLMRWATSLRVSAIQTWCSALLAVGCRRFGSLFSTLTCTNGPVLLDQTPVGPVSVNFTTTSNTATANLAVPVAIALAEGSKPSPDTYEASLTGVSATGITLKLEILNWSDAAGREAVVQALGEDPKEIGKTLDKLPSVGAVWQSGSAVGHSVK